MSDSLRLIASGGTFDKRYLPLQGQLAFGDTHLPEVIERCRINAPVELTVLPLLDSLDMQDADRARILDACKSAAETAIVVIHGTDTMPNTAQVLGPAAMAKTVVLTGAMVPYEIASSDALFNLGFAAACARLLPHGVYIAMNGAVFAWDNVTKNRAAGRFETVR
jgi:L-asparaginase